MAAELAQGIEHATTLATHGVKFLAVDPLGGSSVNVTVVSEPGATADPTDSDLGSTTSPDE
jgi:hypothetical protein